MSHTRNLNVLWDLGTGELLEVVGSSDLRGAVGLVACTGVLAGSLLAVLDGGAGLVRVLPLPLVPAQGAAASRLEFALPRGQEHKQGQNRELLVSYTVKRCLVTVTECGTQLQLSSRKSLQY